MVYNPGGQLGKSVQAGLAQKVTTDAAGPLQTGVKSAFSKAA
jgi:hypothetical protein